MGLRCWRYRYGNSIIDGVGTQVAHCFPHDQRTVTIDAQQVQALRSSLLRQCSQNSSPKVPLFETPNRRSIDPYWRHFSRLTLNERLNHSHPCSSQSWCSPSAHSTLTRLPSFLPIYLAVPVSPWTIEFVSSRASAAPTFTTLALPLRLLHGILLSVPCSNLGKRESSHRLFYCLLCLFIHLLCFFFFWLFVVGVAGSADGQVSSVGCGVAELMKSNSLGSRSNAEMEMEMIRYSK